MFVSGLVVFWRTSMWKFALELWDGRGRVPRLANIRAACARGEEVWAVGPRWRRSVHVERRAVRFIRARLSLCILGSCAVGADTILDQSANVDSRPVWRVDVLRSGFALRDRAVPTLAATVAVNTLCLSAR